MRSLLSLLGKSLKPGFRMLGFPGNFILTRHLAVLSRWSRRKLRVRTLPDVYQKWGVYVLELVGNEGVDEGVEIAQESHQRPNCLAKSFLMPGNAVAQTTWEKLAPCTVLERGEG